MEGANEAANGGAKLQNGDQGGGTVGTEGGGGGEDLSSINAMMSAVMSATGTINGGGNGGGSGVTSANSSAGPSPRWLEAISNFYLYTWSVSIYNETKNKSWYKVKI